MNIQNCPRCGGSVRSESIGWKCERCLGFIDMQGNFHKHTEMPFLPPITNADRIRAMSDEELAGFISDFKDCSGDCIVGHGVKDCYGLCATKDTLLIWLQQPTEED